MDFRFLHSNLTSYKFIKSKVGVFITVDNQIDGLDYTENILFYYKLNGKNIQIPTDNFKYITSLTIDFAHLQLSIEQLQHLTISDDDETNINIKHLITDEVLVHFYRNVIVKLAHPGYYIEILHELNNSRIMGLDYVNNAMFYYELVGGRKIVIPTSNFKYM